MVRAWIENGAKASPDKRSAHPGGLQQRFGASKEVQAGSRNRRAERLVSCGMMANMIRRALVVLLAAVAPVAAQTATARVSLRLDSATTLSFVARGFELRVGHPDEQVELTKTTDSATPDLVRVAESRALLPEVVVEVFDSAAAPVMTLRLTGVTIASDRVRLSAARSTLEQQRIAQQEAASSLTSDYQEAERQLATAEELGKTRVTTRQDLARARDRASDLKQRLELLRQRQAIVMRQLQTMGSVDETLTLHFQHMDIESR